MPPVDSKAWPLVKTLTLVKSPIFAHQIKDPLVPSGCLRLNEVYASDLRLVAKSREPGEFGPFDLGEQTPPFLPFWLVVRVYLVRFIDKAG